ncbi:gem-associated protein 4 [Chanos chanos]|uniref:Gem-associated protein 4 n=1 Tax=Chanos chanos TaxID=29144 RepID=A0A6J2VLX9_CHACN|nr:gem-associated protein 4 [Chanos chanos]
MGEVNLHVFRSLFADSWLSCEKTAVLQGGLLLANQLRQPEQLCTMRKEDWAKIGKPIIQAVTEICRQVRGGYDDRIHWRKKTLCILWSKLLEVEKGEDIDVRWMENPLFAVQNSLPEINHSVLYELVKALGLSKIYVELLLCFQPSEMGIEVQRLVKHITNCTTEKDVQLLLEVWWELLKGRGGQKDTLDQLFSEQCANFTRSSTDPSLQASKRFKPDPESQVPPLCIVSTLLCGLKEVKDHIKTPDMCHFALSNCLDTLYTSYLLDHATDLSIENKLEVISRLVMLKNTHDGAEGFDLVEAICEAHQELAAILTPTQYKPFGITLVQALQIAIEVTSGWEEKGLLTLTHINDPIYSVVRLKNSLKRVIESLEKLALPETMAGNKQMVTALTNMLKNLATSVTFPDPESSLVEKACVAIAITDNRLEGFQRLPELFASELNWAFNVPEWLTCLERNKSAFQHKDLIMKLVSTLIAKCQTDADVKCSKKLKEIIVDIFSQLSLSDKNETLAEMLAISPKGLHGCLPKSVMIGFEEELNLAFNCIIQSGAESSLSSAVSAVARVAFQNPEATLCRCCHLAVMNLGTHTLIAKLLQQLPGLRSPPGQPKETRKPEGNLLCSCLLKTVRNKLSTSQEEDQLLSFVGALMEPSISGARGEKLSFLHPAEVLGNFVLSNLISSSSQSSYSLEMCLRLLQSSLTRDLQTESTHWVMNCSPFPLLYCLSQLLNETVRCWEESPENKLCLSMECKELLISALRTLGEVIGKEVSLAPSVWSRALSWLYGRVEQLDWTVRFHLKEVWGDHFKYEVPSSLMSVCNLPDHEWSGLNLPQYGHGTGLLAWMECCCLSDHVQRTMLDSLSLDQRNPDEVSMFSKGFLLAISQTLPWCTIGEWERLLRAIRELLVSGKLHVPFSLEYIDFLPLLDLRSFAYEMRLSVLLLRVFQLLCGSSCSGWLPPQGWAHAERLYACAVREIIGSLKAKVPLPTTANSPKVAKTDGKAGSEEVLFVLSQLFCHVVHVQVMMQGGAEPLFLCALEILSHYEAVVTAYPKSSSALQDENTRHFLTTIANNLENAEMKAVLHQKIAQL